MKNVRECFASLEMLGKIGRNGIVLIMMIISFKISGQDTITKYGTNFINSAQEGISESSTTNLSGINGSFTFGLDTYSNEYLIYNKEQSRFYWNGNVNFSLLGLPIGFRLQNSPNSLLSGAQNFRFRFDRQQYLSNVKQSKSLESNALKAELDSLHNIRQDRIKKLAYKEHILKNKEKYSKLKMNSLKVDSAKIPTSGDHFNTGAIDTLEYKPNDSVNHTNNIDELYYTVSDSLKLINEIKSDKEQIYLMDEEIKRIELLGKRPNIYPGKSERRISKIFRDIKILDIGYTYPSYSHFLVRGNLLKGFNMEYENNSQFLALSYGNIQRPFSNQNIASPVDQFVSFLKTDYTVDKRIMAVKTGFGKKFGSHFYVGGLYGRGNPGSYYINGPINSSKTENYVLEIDAGIQPFKNAYLNIIGARSFLNHYNLSDDTQSYFLEKRSNAFESTFTYLPDKFVNRVKANIRYIDPLFKSYGINFLTTNLYLYNVEVQKNISKKLKMDIGYKRECFNMYSESPSIIFNNLLVGADFKLSRHLRLSARLQPSLSGSNNFDDRLLSYFLINYNKVNNRSHISLNISANDLRVINDSLNYSLHNLILSAIWGQNKKEFNATIMHTRSKYHFESFQTTYSADIIYKWNKKINSLCGGRYTFDSLKNYSIGYVGKIEYSFIKIHGLKVGLLYEKRLESDMFYWNAENTNFYRYNGRLELSYNF